MRLTSTGGVVLVTAIGLFTLGWWTTDNLLVLVGLVLGSPLGVDALWGRWALRSVSVERRLPAELFAGLPATGHWLVEGVRGPCTLDEEGGSACAVVTRSGEVSSRWTLPHRGEATLTAVVLSSHWPLGLVSHRRRVSMPASLWVAPTPRDGAWSAQAHPVEGDPSDAASRLGDFHRLRSYASTDAARSIHWRTSARRGELVVVERRGGGGSVTQVVVQEARGEAWERSLQQACGTVIERLGHGPVCLVVAGRRVGPGRDGRFRQDALRALAQAERR